MRRSGWRGPVCRAWSSAGWGRIINFAGMNAMHGYNGRAHVSDIEARQLGADQVAGQGVRSRKGLRPTSISPGPIKSEHDDPAMTKHINEQASRIPIGRLGEPSEVAAVVTMLVSDGGAFVNGQMLQVNGGTQT